MTRSARKIPYHTWSAVFTRLWYHLWLKLHTEKQKYSLYMFMSDKKPRLWSDAVQNARRLIRAWSFCPSIRQVFADNVTYSVLSNETPSFDNGDNRSNSHEIQTRLHVISLLELRFYRYHRRGTLSHDNKRTRHDSYSIYSESWRVIRHDVTTA